MSVSEEKLRLQKRLQITQRLLAAQDARNSLLRFMKFEMYDPEDPDNVEKSRYKTTPQAKILTEAIERVDQGKLKRLAVSISPQTGKTQVLSRHGIAWLFARNPRKHIILAMYNETMAENIGSEVRDIIGSKAFQQAFPNFRLKKGGESKKLLESEEGGRVNFVGVGGSTTGMRADVFIIDDPIKNDEEANSQTFREAQWSWFNSVVSTRCRKSTAIVIVHTRWHEDDLIGRLCDPSHPERNKKYKGIAEKWTYMNIPALVTDPKLASALGLQLKEPEDPEVIEMFGKIPMASLWEDEFPLDLLAEFKRMDSRSFNALRMGKPTPDDGAFFTNGMLLEYDAHELPKNLRKYGASDHAVSTKQEADSTVLGCIGIDEDDNVWIMPDLVWDKMETDRTVEELLTQFKAHRPLLWWMESELISKSFGPFLKKRMLEEKIYALIDPVTVSKDKKTRARAIQGRMAMGKVRFPRHAPWWPDAKQQLLSFPYGAHDDFVDYMSHIGLGLLKEVGATKTNNSTNIVAVGSLEWMLAQTRVRASKEKRQKASEGW